MYDTLKVALLHVLCLLSRRIALKPLFPDRQYTSHKEDTSCICVVYYLLGTLITVTVVDYIWVNAERFVNFYIS